MPIRAVFLDKDGTLIENVPYNVDPVRIRMLPGAAEGLEALHAAGYRIIVVSNQSGIARGYFAENALGAVENRLREMLAQIGVPLAGFYYCPHHPEGVDLRYAIVCWCRKPQPGLLFQAAADLEIDLRQSWLIGDILDDVEAGRRAGCKTILLNNGNETEWVYSRYRHPHRVALDLREAATRILHPPLLALDQDRYFRLVMQARNASQAT
jgi:histidinol-phosphate phosphatase family protein